MSNTESRPTAVHEFGLVSTRERSHAPTTIEFSAGIVTFFGFAHLCRVLVINLNHKVQFMTPNSNRISLVLGIWMLTFGVLKFFDPINGWYRSQIALARLPPISYYPGISGEIAVGLLFLLPVIFRHTLLSSKKRMYLLASTMLIFMMLVAVYVHLQPGVPADVLPLKIKPPFVPFFVMALSAFNLVLLIKKNNNST